MFSWFVFILLGCKFWHTHKQGVTWNINEKALHITCKELLAIYNSMGSFKTYFQNKHVKIFLDSQVEVQITNKTEKAKSLVCNDIAENIWIFCVKDNIWIFVAQFLVMEIWFKIINQKRDTKMQSHSKSYNISKAGKAI